MKPSRKVFCLGLDGATWSVLRPLVDSGNMPNLRLLMRRGISGVARSTQPPLTPAAWSTFQTGCNPGKHGIIDFQLFDRSSQQPYFVNATSLRVPTLWQILSEHGLRVAVIDLPVTYPPPRVNGAIVSGLMTPNRDVVFTRPGNLREKLEAHLEYEWPLLKEEQHSGQSRQDLAAFLSKMKRFIDSRAEAMQFLLQRESFDFAFLQFQCIDFLQHPFWKFLDPSHPAFDAESHRRIIDGFFRHLDQAIGRLLEAVRQRMGKNTLILVVSDHGFQSHHARAELNHYLYRHGFVVSQRPPVNSWARWAELIRKLDVFDLRKKLVNKSRVTRLTSNINLDSIDREQSRAWAFSSFWGFVFLHEKSTSGDYERLAQVLHQWRDANSGRPIVRAVYRKHELFHGAVLQRFPDVIVEPAPGFTFASKTYFRSGQLVVPVPPDDAHAGTHAPEGVFVLAGPGVKPSQSCEQRECDLMDFAPTLLHWMGLPVPHHCDGLVRHEWFHEAGAEKSVVYEQSQFEVQDEERLSDDEQHEIERRLQTLGYM